MQFRDLQKQYQALKDEIDNGINEVLSSSRFIGGSQVRDLEALLAEYSGVKNCITCANGTDAITIALSAMGIGKGDAVFVPDFTFFSSGECPAGLGATPVFVDVDPVTFNIDPDKLEDVIKRTVNETGLTPKAIVPVDLFGLPADYTKIIPIARKYSLFVLEDGAQGFGGMLNGKRACSFGDMSTTSFFPAKPLGCYGDGGAIFTDNDEWADIIRSLCVHGKSGEDKYDNIRLGFNSRLDTIQAAVLIPKLKAFEHYELEDVNKAAGLYCEKLKDSGITVPFIPQGFYSSWAQFTVVLPQGTDRNKVQEFMRSKGIPTMVYYAKPMHMQGAFAGTLSSIADCPVTEDLCERVLSLPIHPYMTEEMVCEVADDLLEAFKI